MTAAAARPRQPRVTPSDPGLAGAGSSNRIPNNDPEEPMSTPTTAAKIDLLTVGEDCDFIVAFGHHNLVEFAVHAYDFGRYEDFDIDELRDAVIASRHTYARGPTPEDYADIEDDEERVNALNSALEEDWLFWTDEPTDRPVTITGRLT